jgi:hypothetical protein
MVWHKPLIDQMRYVAQGWKAKGPPPNPSLTGDKARVLLDSKCLDSSELHKAKQSPNSLQTADDKKMRG